MSIAQNYSDYYQFEIDLQSQPCVRPLGGCSEAVSAIKFNTDQHKVFNLVKYAQDHQSYTEFFRFYFSLVVSDPGNGEELQIVSNYHAQINNWSLIFDVHNPFFCLKLKNHDGGEWKFLDRSQTLILELHWSESL